MKNKTLLKDVAYDRIKRKILGEEVEYISENLLVDALQMSRTPIREALQRLQHEGFIKILPNQGIAITDLTVSEMNDITDYRIAVETASLKQAIHLLIKEDYDELNELIEKQTDAVTQKDPLLYLQYDVEFHLYLLKVVGNGLFIQAIEHVTERQYRLHRRIKSNPQQLFTRIQEHIQIVHLLKNQQADLAGEQLEDHLKNAKVDIF